MKTTPFSFELVEGAQPVRTRPYPLSMIKKNALEKMIDILLANDIIEISTCSEWNSPLLLVSKGDGRWRLVVDYRKANSMIRNQAVVYPRPDDIFETVIDAYIMFMIDGRDFYFQRELAEHLRDMTTFTTHIQSYRWKRCPQGLKPSSAAAINPVTNALSGALHHWALLHCDDVLGWAQKEEQSRERFDYILTKFNELDVTLGWFKIWILLDRAEYVSHVITNGRVFPSPKMVSTIDKIPSPKTVKNVQTFIGMCQYFSVYIPMMAEPKALLTALTVKDAEFEWTEAHEEALVKLKKLLKVACLYVIDWSREIFLVTDASGISLGGCLMQRDEKGQFHPLRYLSRSLDKYERAQENREREMRAGLYCMIKCNSVLAHNVFTWFCDHANVQWIMVAKAENQRIARLALWLSMYWYNLQHLAGTHDLMKIADALSRLEIEDYSDKAIFEPFEDENVQHILQRAVVAPIIHSHVQFSNNVDTHAELTRTGVSVAPNETIEYIASFDCYDESSTPSTTVASMIAGLAEFNSIDVYAGLGSATTAMNKEGFAVYLAVEAQSERVAAITAESTETLVVSDASLLTAAIARGAIKLPTIHVLHAFIGSHEATAMMTTEQDPCLMNSTCTTRAKQVVKLARTINVKNSETKISAIVMTVIDSKRHRDVRECFESLENLGYQAFEQQFDAARFGDKTSATLTIYTFTRQDLPRFSFVQCNDNDAKIASITRLECRKSEFICKDKSTKMVVYSGDACRGRNFDATTSRGNGTNEKHRILAQSETMCWLSPLAPMPQLKSHIYGIIVNPEDESSEWRGSELDNREMAKAYSLHEEAIDLVEENDAKDFIATMKNTPPSETMRKYFSALHKWSIRVASKTGGDTTCSPEIEMSGLSDAVIADHVHHHDMIVAGNVVKRIGKREKRKSRRKNKEKLLVQTKSQRKAEASKLAQQRSVPPAVPDQASNEESKKASQGGADEVVNDESPDEPIPAPHEEVSDDDNDLEQWQKIVDGSTLSISVEAIRGAQKSCPTIRSWSKLASLRTRIEAATEGKWDPVKDTLAKDTAVAQMQSAYFKTLTEIKIPKGHSQKVIQGHAQHIFTDEDTGILMFANANKQHPVPILNASLGAIVIKIGHDLMSSCHLGGQALLSWSRLRYWWLGMKSSIDDHVKHCTTCQRMKFASSPGYGFMNMRWYDRPGRCICIDLVVLHHSTNEGTKFIFTILDSFSHYPDAYCLKNDTAVDCAKCMLKWCQTFGMPEECRSDGGRNLNVSEIFKELYKLLKIGSIISQPYAPQSNVVERFHRWLGAALRILYHKTDLDVDDTLPLTLWIYRGTPCSVTKFTPSLLQIGRDIRFPLDVFNGSAVIDTSATEFVDHTRKQMEAVWQEARVAQMIAQEESAYYYNKRHGVIRNICQGDKVFVKNLPRTPGEVSTHMLPRCSGVYRVLRISSKGARLKHTTTGVTRNSTMRHLRKAYIRSDDEHYEEQGDMRLSEKQFVVVKLVGIPKTAKRKWQVAQLVHTTPDQDAWVVQWLNTSDHGPMLDATYKLAWSNEDGEEEFSDKQKIGFSPLTWTVRKHRFLSVGFQMRNGKLPADVKATLRTKFSKSNL